MSRYTNPNPHRHRSAAALRFDCSMLAGDETVFLIPRDQGRRFFGSDHHPRHYSRDFSDQNHSFPRRGVIGEEETLILNALSPDRSKSEEAIAKHVRSRARDHAVDDGAVCVVCQDDLVGEIGRITLLDCGHEYHERCIVNWLNVNNTCPLCKATVIVAS